MEQLERQVPESNGNPFGPSLVSTVDAEQSNGRKFGQDIRRLLKLVCTAFLNPSKWICILCENLAHILVKIPWDIEDYYKEHVKMKKDRKRVKFPNPRMGTFSLPLTVVDSKGRIVLWYLPGLLSRQHQVLIFLASLKTILTIQISLKSSAQLLALDSCLSSL